MADERAAKFKPELTPTELAQYRIIFHAPRDPYLRDFPAGPIRDAVRSLERKGAIHINGTGKISLTRKGEPGFTLPRRSKRPTVKRPPSVKSMAAIGLAIVLALMSSCCCICLLEGRPEWLHHSLFEHAKYVRPEVDATDVRGATL